MTMTLKKGPFTGVAPPEYLSLPYKPDNFQLHAFRSIEDGDHVIVTAHTGSGKTLVALYAIARALKKGLRTYYTTPIKALSNQKYAELKEYFKEASVGIQTGDRAQNPDGDVVVCTTEILRNRLSRSEEPWDKVGVVVFDEVHYINDPSRGAVWEETIVLLPSHIQQIMLSATINKPEDFAESISRSRFQNVTLIPTSHRVVPLQHHFWKVPIMNNVGDYDASAFERAVTELGHKDVEAELVSLCGEVPKPTLVFVFNRDKCEALAKLMRGSPKIPNLLSPVEARECLRIFDDSLRPFGDRFVENPQISQLRAIVPYGIAYHHSGIAPILKEVIEGLFSRKLIKILVVTETFSVGINMPSKSVIFTSMTKFDGERVRALRRDEYFQMAGRAGRRGLDERGDVFICTQPINIRDILTGEATTVSSKFKLDYTFILRQVVAGREPGEVLSKTLSFQERARDIKRAEIELEEAILDKQKTYGNYYVEKGSEEDLYHEYKIDGSNKSKKKLEKLIKEFSREKIKALETVHNRLLQIEQRDAHIRHLDRSLHALKEDFDRRVGSIVEYLVQIGFISIDEPERASPLTLSGELASEINECDPVFLLSCINEGVFDNLDMPCVFALLSCFISSEVQEERDTLQEIEPTARDILRDRLGLVAAIEREINSCRERYDIHGERLHTINCDTAWLWVSGAPLSSMHSSVSAGQLIYRMLKLKAVGQRFEKVVEKLERYDLMKQIEGYEKAIIRSIVTAESLYS